MYRETSGWVNGLKVQCEQWYFTIGFGIGKASRRMTRLGRKILRERKGCERNAEISGEDWDE
jgi:hypothetical protein